MAGTSLSFERSPLAPKITIAHGAAVRISPSLLVAPTPRRRSAVVSSMSRRRGGVNPPPPGDNPRGKFPRYCGPMELQLDRGLSEQLMARAGILLRRVRGRV